MRVLMTSIGRRVSLVKLFRDTFPGVWIAGGDCLVTAPALECTDKAFALPYNIDDRYMETVLNICIKEKIDIAIPLIDPELLWYAKYKMAFQKRGVVLMISNQEAVSTAVDKLKTYQYFYGQTLFRMPFTSLLSEYKSQSFTSHKVILKPRDGSGGAGIYSIDKENVSGLASLLSLDGTRYIVQEYVLFDMEVTVDVFASSGKTIELCQRKRLKVRGGEVEQAVTIKDDFITKITSAVVSALNFSGVINLQIMVSGGIYYLGEINARLGGGFPLSHHAGARLLEHIQPWVAKKTLPLYETKRYKEAYYMLRYDEALYLDKKSIDDRFSNV
jgi:carbamoyl-phosphate synthase large subunit